MPISAILVDGSDLLSKINIILILSHSLKMRVFYSFLPARNILYIFVSPPYTVMCLRIGSPNVPNGKLIVLGAKYLGTLKPNYT